MSLSDTLRRVINKILRRDESVDSVLSQFNKYQGQLTAMAARCRTLAVQEEERARKLLEHARRQSDEAERAITIASRFSDLTK